MRAKIHALWIVIASASVVSCTALLGLSDKTFDGAGGGAYKELFVMKLPP